MEIKEVYMRRALDLARKGEPYAHPNPMVGAVIVDSKGEILGEGYHRRCGLPHAEVNAINSVADQSKLEDSTMYVTLEPCAHQGRTGPCAKLIIDKKIPRVVVGVRDPFEKVDGKGIEMLHAAGIEVKVGVLERECRSLNAVFFTAHTLHRPFIFLKWAQSSDGWLGKVSGLDQPKTQISDAITQSLMHQWRARFDAIMVGANTIATDNPHLDVRCWCGPNPRPLVLSHSPFLKEDCYLASTNALVIDASKGLEEAIKELYGQGITSVMVEGGANVLNQFVELGLWDVARVECSKEKFGECGLHQAPILPDINLVKIEKISESDIKYYSQNPYFDVKNL